MEHSYLPHPQIPLRPITQVTTQLHNTHLGSKFRILLFDILNRMRLTIKMINLFKPPPTPFTCITKATNHEPLQPLRLGRRIGDILSQPKFLLVAIFIYALTILEQSFSGMIEERLVEIGGAEDCVGACEGGDEGGRVVQVRSYEGDVFGEGFGGGGVGIAG